jgi:hypothetical protein
MARDESGTGAAGILTVATLAPGSPLGETFHFHGQAQDQQPSGE